MTSDECVNGRAQTMSPTMDGSALTEKMVPQRNVIGMMTRLVNTFNETLDFASRPAATPSRENMMHDRRRDTTVPIPSTRSGVRNSPRTSRIELPISPLSIPMTAFPNTMDEVCIGLRISSSKLVWNSLCMMIF